MFTTAALTAQLSAFVFSSIVANYGYLIAPAIAIAWVVYGQKVTTAPTPPPRPPNLICKRTRIAVAAALAAEAATIATKRATKKAAQPAEAEAEVAAEKLAIAKAAQAKAAQAKAAHQIMKVTLIAGTALGSLVRFSTTSVICGVFSVTLMMYCHFSEAIKIMSFQENRKTK